MCHAGPKASQSRTASSSTSPLGSRATGTSSSSPATSRPQASGPSPFPATSLTLMVRCPLHCLSHDHQDRVPRFPVLSGWHEPLET